jgi:uncharacterized protein (DUF1778 family)
MKPESEKLKSRTSLAANDADWAMIQKAAKILGVPSSQYLRETVVNDAAQVVAAAITKKKGAK